MKYRRIIIEVEEDDGTNTRRVIELDSPEYTILDVELSQDFNIKNSSEILMFRMERVSPQSKQYASYIKNPFWR